MRYWDLGVLSAGDVVEVTLTRAANVRLMTSSNYQAFQAGHQYSHHGGYVTQSPWRQQVPTSGRWYVTVDTRGLRDGTRASVTVLPRSMFEPLAPAARSADLESAFRLGALEGRQQPVASPSVAPSAPVRRTRASRSELDEVFRNAAGIDRPDVGDADLYDLFISHASEDKAAVVRPLADALEERGVKVWYDAFTLRVGDSLRRKIDAGIAGSRFGLVVLSPAFLAKQWTQYELDGLVTMAVSGRQVLLPVWHGLSKDEVISFSPSLADRVALNTSVSTVSELACGDSGQQPLGSIVPRAER